MMEITWRKLNSTVYTSLKIQEKKNESTTSDSFGYFHIYVPSKVTRDVISKKFI